MSKAFMAAFAAVSCVHLYASLKENRILRGATKVFLLPLLLGWYLTAADTPQPLVTAALAASWVGDVLLMCGAVGYAVGGLSFLTSHVFYAAAYLAQLDFSLVPVWTFIAVPAVYGAAAMLAMRPLRGSLEPRALYICSAGYLGVNGAMNCFALFRLLALPCTATALTYCGALLFFVSDSILFYVRFKENCVFKTHFAVMLTYIFAQLFIALGFVLL